MKLSEPGSIRPRIWRLCSSLQRRTKKLVYTHASSKTRTSRQIKPGAIYVMKIERWKRQTTSAALPSLDSPCDSGVVLSPGHLGSGAFDAIPDRKSFPIGSVLE
jgi:hypothetical protein